MEKNNPIVFCSPFPGMDIPWTQEKKDELEGALKKYEEVGRCPHCGGCGFYAKALILPEPPDVMCANCNGRGIV